MSRTTFKFPATVVLDTNFPDPEEGHIFTRKCGCACTTPDDCCGFNSVHDHCDCHCFEHNGTLECPVCDGRGDDNENHTCPVCDGNGRCDKEGAERLAEFNAEIEYRNKWGAAGDY